LLNARAVEPKKQPLLANVSETTSVSRKRLGKHVPAETDTHATIVVLLKKVFYIRSVQRGYKENNWGNRVSNGVCEEKRQLEGSRRSERI
jgi:hypothetical protein